MKYKTDNKKKYICANCGNEIWRWDSQVSKAKQSKHGLYFCCVKCSAEYFSKAIKVKKDIESSEIRQVFKTYEDEIRQIAYGVARKYSVACAEELVNESMYRIWKCLLNSNNSITPNYLFKSIRSHLKHYMNCYIRMLKYTDELKRVSLDYDDITLENSKYLFHAPITAESFDTFNFLYKIQQKIHILPKRERAAIQHYCFEVPLKDLTVQYGNTYRTIQSMVLSGRKQLQKRFPEITNYYKGIYETTSKANGLVLSPKELELYMEQVRQKKITLKDVAKKLNKNTSTICRVAKKSNIPVRYDYNWQGINLEPYLKKISEGHLTQIKLTRLIGIPSSRVCREYKKYIEKNNIKVTKFDNELFKSYLPKILSGTISQAQCAREMNVPVHCIHNRMSRMRKVDI